MEPEGRKATAIIPRYSTVLAMNRTSLPEVPMPNLSLSVCNPIVSLVEVDKCDGLVKARWTV